MNLKKLGTKSGFGLVEVLIASGLMALVAAGLVSVVTTMNKEQSNQFRTASLRELKTRFQFLITDQNAWNQTLQNNASMSCLLNKTSCIQGVYDLFLREPAGAIAFSPQPFATANPLYVSSPGYADKGTPCTTFNGNIGAGVDSCPISYKVVWEPMCPVTGMCINPLVRVTVRMLYNPSMNSSNASLSTGAVPPAGSWTDDGNAGNTGKYDVVIKRSATTINKSFQIAVTDGGIGTPSGVCPSSFVARGSGNPWITIEDPFFLVSFSRDNITMKAGTYSCKTSSLGFAVDAFTTRLVNVTAGGIVVPGSIASSNAPSATGLQSVASANPVISIAADSVFQMQQKCFTQTPAPQGNFGLGLPINPYSVQTYYASLSCTQIN